jgi:5-enolpyruvylshikimate-3-phosphate synthase
MEHIATRITNTLKRSGLTARNLAAIANVHYTTIYLITKKGERAKPLPAISESLDRALAVINQLVAENKLPMPTSLSQETKQEKLSQLVVEHTT